LKTLPLCFEDDQFLEEPKTLFVFLERRLECDRRGHFPAIAAAPLKFPFKDLYYQARCFVSHDDKIVDGVSVGMM
jgi:hypothetical protein